MACKVEQPTAAAIWPALLACKRHVDDVSAATPDGLWLYQTEGQWHVAAADQTPTLGAGDRATMLFARLSGDTTTPSQATHEFCLDRFTHGTEPLRSCGAPALHPRAETILRIYLPLILGGWRARRAGKAFVSVHVAQTLDGRIACNNGHSQWISNEANLWHAHRLRALHDAVLVGSKTVVIDDPRLNVRHVEGVDPTRVILSGSASVLRLAGERQIFKAPGCTVLCRSDALEQFVPNGVHRHTEICSLPVGSSRLVSTEAVLAALTARGLHSIFVEGGSATCSSFLEQGRVDVLHVHVAPMILGSGIPSFSLPEVTNIRDSRHLHMQHFEMDDELLFECRLERSR